MDRAVIILNCLIAAPAKPCLETLFGLLSYLRVLRGLRGKRFVLVNSYVCLTGGVPAIGREGHRLRYASRQDTLYCSRMLFDSNAQAQGHPSAAPRLCARKTKSSAGRVPPETEDHPG